MNKMVRQALLGVVAFNLIFSPSIHAEELIYVSDGEDPGEISVLLSGYDLYKQSPSRTAPQIRRKEFIINSKVSLVFCSHEVEKGEWLAKILRKYGYRNPYSLDLILVAIDENGHLQDPNVIEVGDSVIVPILYYSEIKKGLENGTSCKNILDLHESEGAFIIQGPESRFDIVDQAIVFYSGVSSKRLRRNEEGVYNKLSIGDRYPTEDGRLKQQYEPSKEESIGEQGEPSFPEEEGAAEELAAGEEIDRTEEIATTEELVGREEEEEKVPIPHEVVASLGGSFDVIKSNEKNDDTFFISELQPTLELKWIQHWSPQWKSFVGINTAMRSYVDLIDEDKEFKDRELTPVSFFAGGSYVWGESFSLGMSAGVDERIYYQQTTEGSFSLIKDPAPFVGAHLSQKIFQKGGSSISGLALLNNYFAGRQDYEGGLDYGLGVKAKYYFTNKSAIGAVLLYHQGDFESSWVSFRQQWLDFVLKYHIDL